MKDFYSFSSLFFKHPEKTPIFILTGAGISAESGLKTFRDPGGIWSRYRLEEVATPEAFRKNPEKAHQFYNMRRKEILSGSIQPNAAHRALALLEKMWPGPVWVVTQNIDPLHSWAGSKQIFYMHGELLKVRCEKCEKQYIYKKDLSTKTLCSFCRKKGGLRPHVCWFGEVPFEMETILKKLQVCKLFLAIGSSGEVYPAAGFIQELKKNHLLTHGVDSKNSVMTLEFNLKSSAISAGFQQHIWGKASETVSFFVQRFLKRHGFLKMKNSIIKIAS